MIDISAVQTFDHKLSWEAKVFTYTEGFFVNVFSREIFCNAAVVSVGELRWIDLVIEEVVHVDVVNIPLNALKVNVLWLLLIHSLGMGALDSAVVSYCFISCATSATNDGIRWSSLFLFLLLIWVIFIGFLEPMMCQNLGDGHSLARIQSYHTLHDLLSIVAEVDWEREIAL